MSSDEFYLDAGQDVDEGDLEPAVVEDLSRQELDQVAQEQYDLPNWAAVEEQWEREDAEKAAREQAEQEAATAQQYGLERLGEITRKVVHDSGLENVQVPGAHEAAGKLLANREWQRDHSGLEAEPLVAAAVRDGLLSQNVSQAPDENAALARYLLAMKTRGG
jgi:hypothetical protein